MVLLVRFYLFRFSFFIYRLYTHDRKLFVSLPVGLEVLRHPESRSVRKTSLIVQLFVIAVLLQYRVFLKTAGNIFSHGMTLIHDLTLIPSLNDS